MFLNPINIHQLCTTTVSAINHRIHQVMFTGLVISSWTESCSTAGGLSLVKNFVQFRSDDGETPFFAACWIGCICPRRTPENMAMECSRTGGEGCDHTTFSVLEWVPILKSITFFSQVRSRYPIQSILSISLLQVLRNTSQAPFVRVLIDLARTCQDTLGSELPRVKPRDAMGESFNWIWHWLTFA